MRRGSDVAEIAATAGRAALAVPGVAGLSPRVAEGLWPVGAGGRTPGVRVVGRGAPERTAVDIWLAVRTGHQATAVARQVRVAVIEALHGEHPRVWATDVTVAVTVTAIV